MPVDVKRKKGETFESFLRRFNKRLMQSKTLPQVKTNAYNRPTHSRNMEKQIAVARKAYREKYEYMKKTGRLPEEKKKKRGRR
jgi:ribosomal protein S21